MANTPATSTNARELSRGYPLASGYWIMANRVISRAENHPQDGSPPRTFYRALGFWCGTDDEARAFMGAIEDERQHADALAEALKAVKEHECSVFMGIDGDKHRRSSWRGMMRQLDKALAAHDKRRVG